jgi:hypothetical protein
VGVVVEGRRRMSVCVVVGVGRNEDACLVM